MICICTKVLLLSLLIICATHTSAQSNEVARKQAMYVDATRCFVEELAIATTWKNSIRERRSANPGASSDTRDLASFRLAENRITRAQKVYQPAIQYTTKELGISDGAHNAYLDKVIAEVETTAKNQSPLTAGWGKCTERQRKYFLCTSPDVDPELKHENECK
jgi:hypothetical protein